MSTIIVIAAIVGVCVLKHKFFLVKMTPSKRSEYFCSS